MGGGVGTAPTGMGGGPGGGVAAGGADDDGGGDAWTGPMKVSRPLLLAA